MNCTGHWWQWILTMDVQFGGSPIKVGDEEFSIFRDHEYVYHMDI